MKTINKQYCLATFPKSAIKMLFFEIENMFNFCQNSHTSKHKTQIVCQFRII